MTALEWRSSASLASIFALRMLGLFLILPVFAIYAKTLPDGASPVMVGWALGIYGLTQALLQIPLGSASDRWGRKPVIVFGLVLFAVGSFVAAYADTLAGTIVGRAIQGAGAVSGAVTAFIADSTRLEHRTKAMALVGGSIGLTFAISLVAAPPLFHAWGMHGLFALTGVLAIAAIGVVIWVVPPAPLVVREQADAGSLWKIVLDPQLARLNFGIFALHVTQMAMFIVLPVMLVERGHLPVQSHWHVYLPVVLLSFGLMMPPIMRAERRGQMRGLFMGSIALLVVVELGLGWLAPSLWWIAGWLLLYFLAFNILESSLPSLMSRMAPPARKGLALGLYNTMQAVGIFVGAVAGGALAKGFGAAGVFAVCAGIMAVWLLIARGMRPPVSHRPAAPAAA